MLEMVQDDVARCVNTAVLQCGKQMEKLTHYDFSWIVSFQNRDKHEMLPLELKLSWGKFLSHLGGEGGEDTLSRGKIYNKKRLLIKEVNRTWNK
jgi:hypothetical protein